MSDGTPQHDRKVLHAFSFLLDDPKWTGAVEVVERTTHVQGQSPRSYIDLVLRIGSRYLVLPWKGIQSIEDAIREARPVAEREREQQIQSRMKRKNLDQYHDHSMRDPTQPRRPRHHDD